MVFYIKIVSAVAELVVLDTESVKICGKLQILWHFKNFKNFDFFFSKMYRELRENIQVLENGLLESDENWHAAVKWREMIKCKICILAKNILGRRNIIFFVWRGGLKMFFFGLL